MDQMKLDLKRVGIGLLARLDPQGNPLVEYPFSEPARIDESARSIISLRGQAFESSIKIGQKLSDRRSVVDHTMKSRKVNMSLSGLPQAFFCDLGSLDDLLCCVIKFKGN